MQSTANKSDIASPEEMGRALVSEFSKSSEWGSNEPDLEKSFNLIASGADLEVRNHFGETILMRVARKGFPDIAEAVIRKGALIDAIDKEGYTALQWAGFNSHPEVAKLIEDESQRLLTKAVFESPVLQTTMQVKKPLTLISKTSV
jgi:hypothetical protein